MRLTLLNAPIIQATAIALGNFDGIHRGHQKVLAPILSSEKNLSATVVSFTPHPREFFTGQPLKLLTPLTEKIKYLEFLGVEQLVLIPFNRELAKLTPEEFVREIIIEKLRAKKISVGEDFRFGYQRKGTTADLKILADEYGIEVTINSLLPEKENIRISSSLIRQALQEGNLSLANSMLGRHYQLIGRVISGQQLGRKIGFPTANLELPEDKFLPSNGVYSVRVEFEGKENIQGVMNIGCRPTIDGKKTTVEVHLLDWSGDLYGKNITVKLEQFLRPEHQFPSLEALKEQISADCQAARLCLKS